MTTKERHEKRNDMLIKEMKTCFIQLMNYYAALKDSAGFEKADKELRAIIEQIHLKR